jgi:hypothetical protein
MRKVWLLGLAGALLLVVGPMVVAYAEDGAVPPKHERKAGDLGKGDRPPDIVLTPVQEEALKDQVKALQDAIKALKEKSITTLGDKDGKAFLFQSIRKAMLAGEEGGKPRGDHKGKK